MLMICPICHAELNRSLFKDEQAVCICPSCGKTLLREVRLLPYGNPLPSPDSGKARFACPFCEQHYTIEPEWSRPVYCCQSCGKEFLTPGLIPDGVPAPPPPPWAGMRKPAAKPQPVKLPLGYYIILACLLLAVIVFGVLYFGSRGV